MPLCDNCKPKPKCKKHQWIKLKDITDVTYVGYGCPAITRIVGVEVICPECGETKRVKKSN